MKWKNVDIIGTKRRNEWEICKVCLFYIVFIHVLDDLVVTLFYIRWLRLVFSVTFLKCEKSHLCVVVYWFFSPLVRATILLKCKSKPFIFFLSFDFSQILGIRQRGSRRVHACVRTCVSAYDVDNKLIKLAELNGS